MKKRKRAPAEARRDPSTAGAQTAAETETKAPKPEGEPPTQETAPPAEATPSGDAPAQTASTGDAPGETASAGETAASDHSTPASEDTRTDEVTPADEMTAADETWRTEDDAQAAPDSPASVPGASAPGQAAAAGASPEDDDSGWEDAPTRELDVGNMEFAATWTDAHDTLPNVEAESEADDAALDGEAAPEGEGPEDGEALPTDTWRVESILESLLFATDRPLSVSDLKRLLAVKDAKIVTDALGALRDRRADSGIQLISVAGGWQLRTHPTNGAWVAKLVAGRPQRLSRAMMETLAIVAYRQPITRPEIDEIRGVDCGPVLRTLLDRNLIRIIGKKEEVGRPMLYGTTPEFLKTFSLRDLTELPTLREFHELGADEKAQVDKKMPRPEGDVGSDAVGAAGDTPLRPATVDLPQADPAEDDELFDELDRATAAAARASDAAAPPAEPAAEGEPASASGGGEG